MESFLYNSFILFILMLIIRPKGVFPWNQSRDIMENGIVSWKKTLKYLLKCDCCILHLFSQIVMENDIN